LGPGADNLHTPYKKVVLDVKSKPKDVADFFLAIVEASFGTVEPDP